jgi:hypothetical protein
MLVALGVMVFFRGDGPVIEGVIAGVMHRLAPGNQAG